jgi:hypothetical protein
MSRSPLAYPLNRSADTDAGGAADLQTDIMRFMAILSMCLLAIFALVQSIPLAPVEMAEPPLPAANKPVEITPGATQPAVPQPSALERDRPDKAVVLTRPKWIPKYSPAQGSPATDAVLAVIKEPVQQVEPKPVADPAEDVGFTLRFASDAALMRAVAAQQVGLYAIEPGPRSVIQALDRAGADSATVSWGVTLPGDIKAQLDELLGTHQGGSLIITPDGDIHWEAS